ncbi:hypothetical protein BRD17_02120 [Halobacteriales archaeon SW_7_68_16]|nr:MAG: hypothetical protein BRD17_02120 [Halobacteriales archaeon SW_7_68_16]
MSLQQFAGGDGRPVRQIDGEGGTTVVADLGAGRDASVDVIGTTAIVVGGDDRFEIELPAPAAGAFITNGVLTVELEGDA